MSGQKMAQITTTELPQSLPTLLIEVDRTKTPLTVIHEGKAGAIVYPATPQTLRPSFGAMKGSGEILGDLIAPVAEPWDLLEGNFYWIPTFGYSTYTIGQNTGKDQQLGGKLELLEVSGVGHGNNETAIAYWMGWHIASPNARGV